MTSEQVDISEGFHETFRYREDLGCSAIAISAIMGVLAVGLAVSFGFAFGFTAVGVLGVLFFGFSTFLLFSSAVVGWRTRVEVSSEGIRYRASWISKERVVLSKDVMGVNRLPFGEIHILVTGASPIRIGTLENMERMIQLIETMLSMSGRESLRKTRIGPAEWITRIVFPLIVITGALVWPTVFLLVLIHNWFF